MDVTLINPPEQLRVWAGIPKAMAHGVYCFPPLGLMYMQASVEARTPFRAEVYDPVVDDLDYPDFEAELKSVIHDKCNNDEMPPDLLARIEACFDTDIDGDGVVGAPS